MSFLWGWVSSVLSYFGLYSKDAKILFLGLDNAGKTTLLNMLKNDKIGAYNPTHHPGEEELTINNVHMKAFDLGGHEAARKLWASYFPEVDAVIYLVDANDRERFPEAKKELDVLLTTDALKDTPFLVLGNKIDMPTAASEPELRAVLGLSETTGKDGRSGKETGVRPVEVFMCSIMKKTGYPDGIKWLTGHI